MGLHGSARLREALCTLVAAFLALAGAPPVAAQSVSLEELISGVVRIKAFINPEGRSVRNLGREREGSGVVIDSAGLVVTIGYLMVEAHAVEVQSNDGRTVPAEVVGYDHASGFGLVRTLAPLRARPLTLGRSEDLKERTPLLIASHGGVSRVLPVELIAKREYAGSWEYLLDQAIFTAPAHPAWSGAALINSKGELVGIGSLILGDVSGKGDGVAGNMFVPIELLPPILGDLISLGRVSGPARPWLGLTTEEARGRLVVSRVVPEGPAEKAGMRRGDVIVGVAGAEPKSLADFYRKVWAVGEAGVTVPLDVQHGGETRRVEIKSMDRLDHLKLKSSF